MVPSICAMLQVTLALVGIIQEKIRSGPKKSKTVPKTFKVEGYYTRFRTFTRPELPTPWYAF